MRGAVLYGPPDVRLKDRDEPQILQPGEHGGRLRVASHTMPHG